ncbi:hypothetical protein CEXT_769971 [Caerostris extrusa]|uniref:Uncharacterized protein n=1 Tax=Caerostris extrusa TaxID=172846 RepID=A0AAV4T2E4_CAEEX|nr:hypothetical protein CEXT_769971 [Caerostris extrusa]
MEVQGRYSKKEPLTKAQSVSHLDAYQDSVPYESKQNNHNSKFGNSSMKEPASVAMFIDLKDEVVQNGASNRVKVSEHSNCIPTDSTQELSNSLFVKRL